MRTEQRKKKVSWRERLEVIGFTVPALVVYVAFVFVPIGYALIMSLFDGSPVAPFQNFVGVDNFTRIFNPTQMLGQPFFWDAVRNNLLIAVMSLLLQGPLALGVALLLSRKIKFRQVFRLLIFVPYVLSEVITGVIFAQILNPTGALNALITDITGADAAVRTAWLGYQGGVGSPSFWILMGVLTWKYIGLAIILFLAGLSGIPEELTEAAMVDGASWWQIQRKITIPLLSPTIRMWAFLSLIGSFQLFDMVWILFGPTQLSRQGLHTMATYMVSQGMNANRVGYGSAVAVVLFVMTLIVALLYQKFILHRDIGKDA
jgi:ABC-type sugar transport system permease subunit